MTYFRYVESFLFPVEEVVQLLEQVTSSLGSRNYDKSVLSLIIRLNASLKAHGNHIEMFHRELLDKAQVNAGLLPRPSLGWPAV